jgi:hypothetical protein
MAARTITHVIKSSACLTRLRFWTKVIFDVRIQGVLIAAILATKTDPHCSLRGSSNFGDG